MSWVFHHSEARGTDRLVLLAIADSANDHGREAWPSLATIARKAGIDRRTVSRCLLRLEEAGELRRVRHGGLSRQGGTSNSYEVVMSEKQGRGAPSGEVPPLGASRPEVGAQSPRSGGDSPHYPSRTIQPIRADAAESDDLAVGADLVAIIRADRAKGKTRDEAAGSPVDRSANSEAS